ncbi:wax ester/triacylglycerol synthase family O-acyltransferase [bacterium]|nr:wax ester/triacylglycerol synthase family O-acyltransferase [bacterium]
MRRLSPLDAAWLTVESRDTPMHVASLVILSKPKNAGENYLIELAEQLRSSRTFVPPFNLKIKQSPLKNVLPVVKEHRDIDMEYHVRHSALPKPGGERELGQIVSRLHAHQLDLTRPLWECHLIEGLEGDRFALYTKMHHSLVDGVAGVRILQQAFSTNARDRNMPPPWSKPAATNNKAAAKKADPEAKQEFSSPTALAAEAMGGVKKQAKSVSGLARIFGEFGKARGSDTNKLSSPFDAPKSVFNGRVTPPRRFATQQYDITRVKKVAAAAGVTLNDVVLGLCGTALRRFLLESNALPDKSLTAGIPVSVRPAGDINVGTAISFIISTLGTDIADPKLRLEEIHQATTRAKQELQKLSRSQIDRYTLLLMGPFIGALVAGLGGRTRPVFNITISNVPGPDKPLYFNGARMEGIFPVSLLSHGQALNITCLSYNGNLNFGFTACRDTLPHTQRLSVYTGEALEEYEALYKTKTKSRAKAS